MTTKNHAPNSPKTTAIVVGRIGQNQLLDGWHERQTDGRNGIVYRASGGESRLLLSRLPGAKWLHLIVSAPVDLMGGESAGTVSINRRSYDLSLWHDAWVLRSFPLQTNKDVLEIHFTWTQRIVPDRILGNGDLRELSFYLTAAWQE